VDYPAILKLWSSLPDDGTVDPQECFIVQVGNVVKPTIFLQSGGYPETLSTKVEEIEEREVRISLGFHGAFGRPYASLPVKINLSTKNHPLKEFDGRAFMVTGLIDTGSPITYFAEDAWKSMGIDRAVYDHIGVTVMRQRLRPSVTPEVHHKVNIWGLDLLSQGFYQLHFPFGARF